MRCRLLLALATGSLAVIAFGARAAGGHFDVDDATILAPGHCQYELWANRTPASDADNLHLGPACRVGPFEIGLDVDHTWTGEGNGTSVGPHVKWAHALPVDGLSAGAVLGTAFDLRQNGRQVAALYFAATWAVSAAWAINVNAGWDRADGTTHRLGGSAEWSPQGWLTLLAEHVRTGGALVSRLGTRFIFGKGFSVDLSAARVGGAGRLYTLGLNHDFER